MNLNEFTPGKQYIVKGNERYLPVGFGSDYTTRKYTDIGKFEQRNVDKLIFDTFKLVIDKTDTLKFQLKYPQQKLNSNITINEIIEVK